MDRMLLAALRQRVAPRHRVSAPEGVRARPGLGLPATPPPGAVDAMARARAPRPRGRRSRPRRCGCPPRRSPTPAAPSVWSTSALTAWLSSPWPPRCDFALRTPAEQEALVASFGRYLHSLTAPVQVLVRTERLDLSGQISELLGAGWWVCRTRRWRPPRWSTPTTSRNSGSRPTCCAGRCCWSARAAGRRRPPTGLGGPSPLAVLAALARGRRHASTSRARRVEGARRAGSQAGAPPGRGRRTVGAGWDRHHSAGCRAGHRRAGLGV